MAERRKKTDGDAITHLLTHLGITFNQLDAIVVLFGSCFKTQDRKNFKVDCCDLTCAILSHCSKLHTAPIAQDSLTSCILIFLAG